MVQATQAPQFVGPVKGGVLSQAIDESTYTDPPTSGGVFALTGPAVPDNWSTKGFTTGYFWHIGVQLDDGQTYYVSIGLR